MLRTRLLPTRTKKRHCSGLSQLWSGAELHKAGLRVAIGPLSPIASFFVLLLLTFAGVRTTERVRLTLHVRQGAVLGATRPAGVHRELSLMSAWSDLQLPGRAAIGP